MDTNLSHFAINADDVSTSRSFYESVFGWTFTAWGPPGFYKVTTGSGGVEGALQQRRQLGGVAVNGIEATFAVDDVDRIAASVEAAGGQIVLPRHTIAGVGHVLFFSDPAGNMIGAMQYDTSAE